MREIYAYLMNNTDHFMCVQDDYLAWHYNDETNPWAKPLILDVDSHDTYPLFFDDHCNPDQGTF